MPETKNNRRVRFTRSALREALIDLILEKPLVSITCLLYTSDAADE